MGLNKYPPTGTRTNTTKAITPSEVAPNVANIQHITRTVKNKNRIMTTIPLLLIPLLNSLNTELYFARLQLAFFTQGQ
jgi:hypothetical protein